IPVRTLSLAELITLNGDLTPSKLLREELDSHEVTTSLRDSLTQLEKIVGQIQQFRDDVSLLTHPPAPVRHSTLQQLIDAGSIIQHRGRHQPNKDNYVKDGVEALLVPLRNNGEAPDTVLAAPTSRWLQEGDVLVPPHATMPARVFIDDGQQWVVPIGMSILEVTDSDLDPHYLAACINASFNEAANLGAPIPRRDFKHIE